MVDYYAADDAVTLIGVEADFLTGPWSSEAPWEATDVGIECSTQAPKLAHMASPQASPSGPGCCQG